MTQVGSQLSEKVDAENNTKKDDCKEDITIMEFIETLIYLLTSGKLFLFQNNCQRGILD